MGWQTLSLGYPTDKQFNETIDRIREPLQRVGDQLQRKGDIEGAAKAGLIHRHLYPDDRGGLLHYVEDALNERLGRNGYVYAGVDYLSEMVQKALAPNGLNQRPGGTPTDATTA